MFGRFINFVGQHKKLLVQNL